MNSDKTEDMVRRLMDSMGFPRERVDAAVSCLTSEEHPLVENVLSFKDVCKKLSLSRNSVRRLMDAGELRPIYLTKRRIGFRAQDVARFIESRKYCDNSAHLLDKNETTS